MVMAQPPPSTQFFLSPLFLLSRAEEAKAKNRTTHHHSVFVFQREIHLLITHSANSSLLGLACLPEIFEGEREREREREQGNAWREEEEEGAWGQFGD